jgi:hypothetical protein
MILPRENRRHKLPSAGSRPRYQSFPVPYRDQGVFDEKQHKKQNQQAERN